MTTYMSTIRDNSSTIVHKLLGLDYVFEAYSSLSASNSWTTHIKVTTSSALFSFILPLYYINHDNEAVDSIINVYDITNDQKRLIFSAPVESKILAKELEESLSGW